MIELEFEANPDWRPGPWMQAKVQRVLLDAMTDRGDVNLVVGPKGALLSIPLGGLTTARGSEEDVTCDKCDAVVVTGLWTFAIGLQVRPEVTVMVTGGLCERCATEENAKPLHPKED
jgi:hypothetical protein